MAHWRPRDRRLHWRRSAPRRYRHLFLPEAIPNLRNQLEAQFHLWSNHGGTFRVFDQAHPDPLHPIAQIWARRNAQSPWVLDCAPTPSVDGRWQSKRDPEHIADLDDVTWIDHRGLRVLNPEVVLLFKAAQDRATDRFDLARTWPLLDDAKRQWLRSALGRYNAAHPWHEKLTDA